MDNLSVAIIGGGAAGLMAAYSAGEYASVTLFEKNEKLGKKLYITGKGRCNVTNNSAIQDFMQNIISNPKFCFGALNRFSPADTIRFFSEHGVKLKTERGARVFPESDKSSDIIKALANALKQRHVSIRLNTEVKAITQKDEKFSIIVNDKAQTKIEEYFFDRVIVATGGLSYPSTGSTGDGYVFAKSLGHTIVDTAPSLCPLILKEEISMEGLSLKNVSLRAEVDGKQIDAGQGELMFTKNGISGPLALTLSALINRLALKNNPLIFIDLKPALSNESLDKRILRDFSDSLNKDFCNALDKLLPKRLISDIIKRCGIPQNKKVNSITAIERARIVDAIKNFRFTLTGLADISLAVVTAGGISTREINPSTMESKHIKGLYFAGEVIDIDAKTGGYNIQLALSTGYIAGALGGTK